MTSEISTQSSMDRVHQLFGQGYLAEAEGLCRHMMSEAPEDAAPIYNLGVILVKAERLEEALACFQKAIELKPDFAIAYTNFGFCLNAFNLIKQAREGFAIARSLTPDNPIPIVNEGIAALALGDYAQGWKDFAARWQLPAYAAFKRTFSKPIWSGQDLTGKSLFLYAEQGFGDSLQMARYVSLLSTPNTTLTLEVQPALTRLLQKLYGVKIISKGDPLPPFDYYCALMDIPGVLGTTLETIPSANPYLFADQNEIAFYQNLLSHTATKRIGLSWAGRASHDNDHNRSLAFSQLAPLFARTDIEWVSLQRIVPESDKEALKASSVMDWGQTFPDFAATAAAIMALDLVITVDTAIAHLAGALGKDVWVMLPFYADWRWLTLRLNSPWYPTARLFRQKKRKEWRNVIDDINKGLESPLSITF